jgi:hypothetical protein
LQRHVDGYGDAVVISTAWKGPRAERKKAADTVRLVFPLPEPPQEKVSEKNRLSKSNVAYLVKTEKIEAVNLRVLGWPWVRGCAGVLSGSGHSFSKNSIRVKALSCIGPHVKIRFRLRSDGYGTLDGWYIDDVSVDELF